MKIRKRVMAFLLVMVMALSMVPTTVVPVQAAKVDINLGEVKWSTDYSSYTFPDVSVDFDNNKQKIFCLSVNNAGSFVIPDTINLGTGCKIKGIQITNDGKVYQDSVTPGMELSSITVIGRDITQEQISYFIKELRFKRNVDDKKVEQTVSVVANEVELNDDETAMAVDGVIHYYKYIPFDDVTDDTNLGTLTWYDAYAAAKESEFQGMKGYLTTITEENEQIFIYGALGGMLQAWLGGARTSLNRIIVDADVIDENSLFPGDNEAHEQMFYWLCGPEAGEAFYKTGEAGNKDGAQAINDACTYWNPEFQEPNNIYNGDTSIITDPYGQEYILEYGFNDKGYWNDYSPYNVGRGGTGISGYIIEYSPYILSGEGKNPTEVKEAVPSSTDIQIVVANDIKMEANDFIISTSDAKAVTDTTAKEKAGIAVTETGTPVSDVDAKNRITVDAEDLAEVQTGETGRYNVTYIYSSENGSVSDKATVTVVDVTDISDDGNVVIGANNFNISLEQAQAIANVPNSTDAQDLVKALANAVATNNGITVDSSLIIITKNDITAGEGSYDVTFSYNGESVTVKATVKDDGPTDGGTNDDLTIPGTNLTANDFEVEIGDPVLSEDDFLKIADVEANKNDGIAVTPVVDEEDLAALNNAIKNGPAGTYEVEVSTPDGTSTTIEVTVTERYPRIEGKDFIISVEDAKDVTENDVKNLADATRYESDNDIVGEPSEVAVDNLDDLQNKGKSGEAGIVTITLEDSTNSANPDDKAYDKTVTATVVDVTNTSDSNASIIIGANNFNITLKQAELIKANPEDPDVQAMIKELANAVATDDSKQDGKVDVNDINVDATAIEASNGSYDVTFSYEGQTVTVKATVKDDGAADNVGGTMVPTINLTANDFTVEAGSDALTAADFNKNAEVVSKKNDGSNVTATPDATDLAKLNEAIKNCTEGTYDVKVTSGSETVVVKVTVTKADDTSGVDKQFEISNPKDVTQDLDKGRKVAKVTVDGTDIASDKYKVDGDTLVIDDSVFQNKKADTTSTVVITYSDGSKKTFKVKIVSYDKENVVTKVPIFHMQKDIGVKKTFKLNLVGMNKYSVKKFKSSNKKIATISKDGVIKANKVGKCKITATVIQNGSYYTVKIDLHVKKSMKMYNLKNKALQKKQGVLPEFNVYKRVVKGKTTKLKFTNITKDAKITFKSSNKKIASVSKKGVIKGRKKGFCVITAKIEQSGYTYYTKLIVRVDDGTKNKQLSKYLK